MEDAVGLSGEKDEDEEDEEDCCCCDEDLRPVSASQKDIVDYRGLSWTIVDYRGLSWAVVLF